MKTILCVDDLLMELEIIRIILAEADYHVITAENLAQAREVLDKKKPDAIVLDVMLPDGNGLDFLVELRAAGKKIPILILSAQDAPMSIVYGLELGANDYLPKPFQAEILLARLETMFRNFEDIPETLIKGKLKLQVFASKAFLNNVDLMLTQREFDILLLLFLNENKLVSDGYLFETIWAQPLVGDKNAIQSAISRLRKKIEDSDYYIDSIRDKGYIFTKEL